MNWLTEKSKRMAAAVKAGFTKVVRPNQLTGRGVFSRAMASPRALGAPYGRGTMRMSFGLYWARMLREFLTAGIGGYRRYSLRFTGRGRDRRADKLEQPNRMAARYQERYACV